MPDHDTLLGGTVLLRQAPRGHRAGTDAVLLAASAPKTAGLILDAGAGTGAAGLMLTARCPQARLDLVEIAPELAALARDNLALNGLADRGRVVEADLLSASARRAAGLAEGAADVVLTNPPWLDPAQARLSPDAARALAHAEHPNGGGIDGWLRAATALLAAGGTLAMIHRADRLKDVLDACTGRLGGLAVRPVHSKADGDAIRVVVVGTKGSRGPLRLLPALVLHEADRRFTPLADALHRGEAVLDEGEDGAQDLRPEAHQAAHQVQMRRLAQCQPKGPGTHLRRTKQFGPGAT